MGGTYPSDAVLSGLARLDRDPVRGVPPDLDQAVERADRAFLNATGRLDADSWDTAVVEWTAILADPSGRRPRRFREDVLNRAAVSTWFRGALRSDTSDLDAALALLTAALDITVHAEDRARYLHNMGAVRAARFAVTGASSDIDAAVSLGRRALEDAPHSPRRGMFAITQGMTLSTRFDVQGSLDDLDEAIRLGQLGLRLARNSMIKEAAHEALGTTYRRRFTRTGDRRDIDNAIHHLRLAIDVAHNDGGGHDDNHAVRVTNLGNALLDRFSLTGRSRDLEDAIASQREAVALSKPTARQYPHRLNNLANALKAAHEATADLEWLDAAIETYRESLAITPPSSPEGPSRQYNLANALRERLEVAPRRGDVARITAAYRAAAAGHAQSAEWALGASRNWASWAVIRGAWKEASEASDQGFDALTLLVRTQVFRIHKENWLRDTRGMPARAAYAKAKAGDQQGAVQIAESTRALLLSETLERDHADLARLAADGHRRYATRYRKAVRRFALTQLADSEPAAGDRLPPDRQLPKARRDAKQEMDHVVAQIRSLPGYHDFLGPPSYRDVVADTGGTPLVYVCAAERGGVALAVFPDGTTRQAWLPRLTEATLAARVAGYREAYAAYLRADGRGANRSAWEAAIDDICGWLGSVAMTSVLRLLRGTVCATLIPAGLLGALPLHAAWISRPSTRLRRRCVLDRIVIRYAANARAHGIATRAAVEARERRLFAVDAPTGGGADTLPPLPFSSTEVGIAEAAFPEHDVLRGRAARSAAVASRLEYADVLHLSCHGRAEPEHPLESALAMAGGEPLSVRDVLGRRLRARITLLSACETAIPGDDLPDEVVGFTSAFVQAGSGAAIATLWSVPGLATALLLARFYAAWRVEQLQPPEALVVAQRWLRDTTNAQKTTFLQQLLPGSGHPLATPAVQSLHRALILNPDARRDARDHASPYYWAAFTYVGA